MSKTLLSPIFVPQTGALEFPTNEVNLLLRNEYLNTLDWYQRAFGVYSIMKLNRNNKFNLIQATGKPYLWQASNSCVSDPTKTISLGQEVLEPKATELFEKLCVRDSSYGSLLFEHLLSYNGDTLELTPEMRAILDELTQTLLENAAQGLRLNLTIGSLTDIAALPGGKPASTPQDVWDALLATYDSSIGWVTVAANAAAAGYSWMDLSGVISSGDFNASGDYTANPLDLYDTIKANAPSQLKKVVASGGVGKHLPIFIVDPTLFAAIANKANELAAQPLANTARIVVREVQTPGELIPRRYYVIDGSVVVVPVEEIQGWDEDADIDTYGAFLTTAGNINIGGAFTDMPGTMGENTAITAAYNTNAGSSDFGYMFWRGFSVTASAIAYRDLFAGTVEQF